MLSALDRYLNGTTMYRLLITWLGADLAVATLLGFFGVIHVNGFAIIVATTVLVGACWLTNLIFAKTFGAPVHHDSAYITGLILALIFSPAMSFHAMLPLVWAGIIAMASKYIIAWRGQHLFNPAALAAAVVGATLVTSASWWVVSVPMLPVTIIGGFLILRKMQRFSVFTAFTIVVAAIVLAAALFEHHPLLKSIENVFTVSPLIFFASVMLTEPLTMPGTAGRRLIFAALVAIFFAPPIHFGSLYFSPELALLIGNGVTFLWMPRHRYQLTFVRAEETGPSTVDFIFTADQPLRFEPGQFAELTVPHHPDNRGQRRYFTIASSPREKEFRFGVKFARPSSSFKQYLASLRPGQKIVASQVGGDFTLSQRHTDGVVFIAGGIGITPFRSMVAYLLGLNRTMPMTLIHSALDEPDLTYRQLFEEARDQLGLNLVYTLTGKDVPPTWTGNRGFVDAKLISSSVQNYKAQSYYVSGPQALVNHSLKVLRSLGVPSHQIHRDFFPGFA